jgi:cobalt/nickel transport system ATP-binding protein
MCLKVREREIVSLCGPNGSGKSTLLEHLNGLLLPTEGNLEILGKRVDKRNLSEIRKQVGLVFQDADSQLFSPTILDDVMFGPLNLGLSVEEARDRAIWALKTVGFNEYRKVPHYLSGGEKKLVAIAGVIAMKPKIMVLDEPTSNLDGKNSKRIEELILKARDELGMSLVLATHDYDLAARVSDKVCIVKDGSIVAEGNPVEIFYDRELMDSAGLTPPTTVWMYDRLYMRNGLATKSSLPLKIENLLNILEKDLLFSTKH